MNVKKLVCVFLALITALSLHSQNEDDSKKRNKEDSYKVQEIDYSLINKTKDDEFFFVFNNLGIEDRFYDPHMLESINNATLKGKDLRAIELLEMYIAHFGIRNFSEDTGLLWKLAQLYEKNGMNAQAKAAYQLVLKHHPINNYSHVKDYTTAMSRYDELTELEQDNYVPLDYYYKLVEFRSQIDTLKPPKSVLLNMGQEVNMDGVPEYGPSISSEANKIIFTRKVIDNKNPNIKVKVTFTENLYMSVGEDGFWEDAVELPAPIKSSCNEGSAVLSKDGTFLVFSRCQIAGCQLDCYDCFGSCDLFYSKFDKVKNNWSQPVNFGKDVNSVAWDSQPSFSITEDTIFFASNRTGGFGMSDIYYIYKNRKGEWSHAINMGPVINTRGNEWSPFHSKMHKVFYFSSNGHVMNFDTTQFQNGVFKSSISNDLYKCNNKDGRWLEPKNLGPLVNGAGDETYFSIDANNKHLYYARTEDGAKLKETTDLFSFPVPMEAQPTATTILSGTLTDKETGKPYKGIVSVIDLENGIEVAPKYMRADGTYEFDLIDHNKYLLIIQGDDFFRIEELFQLNGDTTIHSTATSVKEKKLQFTSIIFENGKANILENMHKDLGNIVNFLIDNPEFRLVIGGHTDSDGNEAANQSLSQKRADAIKKYLEETGFIDPERIVAKGFGSTNPIRTPELTEEDKSINRRVEFEIKRIQ
jgi:outer membrane protein OmpA-like peptidoglycan-associated protein